MFMHTPRTSETSPNRATGIQMKSTPSISWTESEISANQMVVKRRAYNQLIYFHSRRHSFYSCEGVQRWPENGGILKLSKTSKHRNRLFGLRVSSIPEKFQRRRMMPIKSNDHWAFLVSSLVLEFISYSGILWFFFQGKWDNLLVIFILSFRFSFNQLILFLVLCLHSSSFIGFLAEN